MVQGINKEFIFEKNEYIEIFLRILKKYSIENKITIISFCIMSNHAHILIYYENIQDVSKLMQKTNMTYAQFYNSEKDRYGVVFRNRYQSEPIYDMRHFINCINYIHMNPVKANIVKKCENYKYSSYKDYMNNTGICKNKIMRDLFGNGFNYSKLISINLNQIFIDIEKPSITEKKALINAAIQEFKKINHKELIDILSNREVLIRLITYLKDSCRFDYKDIMIVLEISKGTMNKLKYFISKWYN